MQTGYCNRNSACKSLTIPIYVIKAKTEKLLWHQQADKLPDYLEAAGKIIGFVDAAYTNDLAKQQSMTGYVFTYSGGAVVYRSKTQSLTILSSTEAEFTAIVTGAKKAKYIRLVLLELGFKQSEPTPIYKDNKHTIDIVALQKPTEQTRHIDICFFAIQDWIHKSKDIQLAHIPGVINPFLWRDWEPCQRNPGEWVQS